jgi:thiol-disulfide isomerase/thioredoxin
MATTKQGSSSGKVPPRPGARSGRSSAPAKGAMSAEPAGPQAKAQQRPLPPRPSGKAGRPGVARGGRTAPRVSARQLAQRRRQRNIYMAIGGAGAVVVVAAVIIAISLTGTTTKAKTSAGLPTGEYDIPANLVAKVEAVPVKDLVAAALADRGAAIPPQALPAHNPELTLGGKPEIFYLGAEYCPYCAAERWPMVMALSKFGSFAGLHGTSSSATDVNPSTPTFAFFRSTFTSKYLAFVPVETLANDEKTTLQAPTKAQQELVNKWDAPPYVSATQAGSIPFIYLAGKYLQVGASYNAAPLSGMNFADAVSYMTSGKNPTSKAAMATAGYLVGDICSLTHGQPASVCSQVPKSLVGVTATSRVSGKAHSISKASKLPVKK